MDPTRLKEINQARAEKTLEEVRHKELIAYEAKTQDTILMSTESLIRYLEGKVTRTEIVNQLRSIGTPDALKVIPEIQALHETLKTHENVDLSELTSVMTQLLGEAKQLPKQLPDIPEQRFVDYTKQFNALNDAVKAVGKFVKDQKLVAEAPIVNVPETNVHVDAPDLQPLQTDIKDVVKAINEIVIPEYKTDNKEVEKLLKASNKLLKEILEKPVGRGGGGSSRVSPYESNGIPAFVELNDGAVPVDVVGDLVPGIDYDNILVTNTSGTTDTVAFRLATNPIRTLAIVYTDSSVQKVSDELVSVDFS